MRRQFKITMLSNHCCIRCTKEAYPLIQRGHSVHMIAHKLPSTLDQFTTFSLAQGVSQFIEAIKIYNDSTDIFHAQNEPSWFVTMVKEHSNKPVVLDVHDSYAARMTHEEWVQGMEAGKNPIRITAEERNNFQLADALVFPGEAFGDVVCSEYGLNQPRIILPSYLPRHMYRYDCKEWIGGLVYEGKVDLKEDIEKHRGGYGFRYADYEELAQRAHGIGMDFHLYTIRDDKPFLKTYQDIAFVHRPRGVDRLIKSLTRHDWGLVGNLEPTPEWEVAFPNKMFEYIAACVPVVAINAKACSRFIEKWGIGITVESLDELAARWNEHRACRANLIKARQAFTMENHIEQLETLYGKVLDGTR